ncbi:MAG: hypothetical protein KIH63_005490 [Candidatus Saccharibacteria bacterium]|nr:hypothetical protein [Candidatus Saccharibacteria bacterium]
MSLFDETGTSDGREIIEPCLYAARSGAGDHYVIDAVPPLSYDDAAYARLVLGARSGVYWQQVWNDDRLTRFTRHNLADGKTRLEPLVLGLARELRIGDAVVHDTSTIVPIDCIPPDAGGIQGFYERYVNIGEDAYFAGG